MVAGPERKLRTAVERAARNPWVGIAEARDEITAGDSGWRIRWMYELHQNRPNTPGMSLSTEGSVAAWELTFHLDGDESLHAAISIRLAGPPTHHEARQKALKILPVFLNDACEAAKKYQFSN
jgi:hypothetical protein